MVKFGGTPAGQARQGAPFLYNLAELQRAMRPAGGWWLVAGGWWLVAGGWWLMAEAKCGLSP